MALFGPGLAGRRNAAGGPAVLRDAQGCGRGDSRGGQDPVAQIGEDGEVGEPQVARVVPGRDDPLDEGGEDVGGGAVEVRLVDRGFLADLEEGYAVGVGVDGLADEGEPGVDVAAGVPEAED